MAEKSIKKSRKRKTAGQVLVKSPSKKPKEENSRTGMAEKSIKRRRKREIAGQMPGKGPSKGAKSEK